MTVTIMDAGADIFRSKARALVDPVDCTGAQGKGLALEFKRRFPMACACFKDACSAREVRPGLVFLVGNADTNRIIVFFPTKPHWRQLSRLGDIDLGLIDMHRRLREIDVRSVAIPALGCGEGFLSWDDVFPFIRLAGERLSSEGVEVEVYPPHARRSR